MKFKGLDNLRRNNLKFLQHSPPKAGGHLQRVKCPSAVRIRDDLCSEEMEDLEETPTVTNPRKDLVETPTVTNPSVL